MNRFRFLFAVLTLLPQPAFPDELRPGYLEMRQTSPDAYNLLFKIPARGEDLRLAIYIKLPEGARDAAPPRASFSETAYVERRSIRRDGGLAGQAVSIAGLAATSTDVLVRIESLAGAVQTERLSPTKTTFIVQATPGAGEVAATYLRLGVEHILFGTDIPFREDIDLQLKDLEDLDLSTADREAIDSGNAARLLCIDLGSHQK